MSWPGQWLKEIIEKVGKIQVAKQGQGKEEKGF